MKARTLILMFAMAATRAAYGNGHGAAEAHHDDTSPEAAAAHAAPERAALTRATEKADLVLPSKHAEFYEERAERGEPVGQLPPEDAVHEVEKEPAPAKGNRPVVAMEAKKGHAVRAGELVTAAAEPMLLIGRKNQRLELSPRSVAELDEQGNLRLLRGSVAVESQGESSVRTAGARVEFVGQALVSYDHAEKSTSAFVLEGEARLVNAHRDDSSMRLQRFHGATLVVGEIVPHLIRQLDVGAVRTWLKGYSWPAPRAAELLRKMPSEAVAAKEDTPRHLAGTKIEDYFSSIDTADELHQPDYYEKKFDDPDKVVAEQNSAQGASKTLTPEEAALISLPKTNIELGFELGPEVLSSEQKSKEVAKVEPARARARTPASVEVKAAKKTVKKTASSGDPEVAYVLERLRRVRGSSGEVSRAPAPSREPASVPEPVVPDPVYDYSRNF